MDEVATPVIALVRSDNGLDLLSVDLVEVLEVVFPEDLLLSSEPLEAVEVVVAVVVVLPFEAVLVLPFEVVVLLVDLLSEDFLSDELSSPFASA